MLEIQNLSFRYPGNGKDVIENFSMQLIPGSVYGLLGPNGAGKTTLLYLISGLLTPKTGYVELNGTNTRLRKPETLSQIFIVPEEFDLPAIKMSTYAKMYAPFYPNFSYQDLLAHLNTFSLSDNINLGQLSMGQKKKAYMSFALASNVPVILMDEPTNGLDIPSKASFRRFIASSMSDDKTIIISTHQVRDIDQLLDSVIIMDTHGILLNETLYEIGRKLNFSTSSNPEEISRALYTMPDVMGTSIVTFRGTNEETPINIELLFQFVVSRPDMVKEIFSTLKAPVPHE